LKRDKFKAGRVAVAILNIRIKVGFDKGVTF
jgi:hypothetical protein